MQISKQRKSALLAIGFMLALFAPILSQRSIVKAAADTCTWTGAGSDTNVSTAANWTGCDNGNVPEDGDILAFDSDAFDYSGYDTTVNNDSLTSIAGVLLTGSDVNQGGLVTLTGNALILAGDIVDTSDVASYMALEFGVDLTLSATIAVSTIVVTSDGSLDIGAYNVTSPSSINISGPLTGSGDISGQFVNLSGNNSTYSGNIVASEGLTFSNINALGTTAGNSTTPNLCIGTSTMTKDINIAENINGIGSATTDIFIGYGCGRGGGGSTTFDNGVLTFTGTITLAEASTLTAFSKNVVFSDLDETNGALTLESLSWGTLDKGDGVKIKAEKIETVINSSDKTSNYQAVSNNETLILNGERGDVYVASGGVLKGTGTATGLLSVESGGTVAPGLSPGCLTVGGGMSLSGNYEFELEGETVCTEYDQIDVTGTVDITGATVDVARLSTYVPELNTEFVIINNDAADAVTGEFTGWAQGAQVVVDQVTYEIDYAGGDGNDVVLTVVAIDSALAAEAGTPDTGLRTILASPYVGIMAIVLSGITLVVLRKKQLI